MQSAIFNISAYRGEIETVYPDELKPVRTKSIDFQQYKHKTKFYNQKRIEENQNILTFVILVLVFIFLEILGKLAGELHLGLFMGAIFLLIAIGGRKGVN